MKLFAFFISSLLVSTSIIAPAQQTDAGRPSDSPTTRISLRKWDVIPVTFDDELSIAASHEGDHFSTTVSDNSYLPKGSHINGFIKKLTKKVDDTPASMELAFDQIILPDGGRRPLNAVPLPLDGKYVQRNPDGRYVAKQTSSRGSKVAIGALAGLALGSLIKKPFEGAALGTLAGILVAETGKDGETLTIKKGSAAGASVQQATSFDVNWAANATPGSLPPSSFEIQVGRKTLNFDPKTAPYYDNGVTMIPLKTSIDQINCTMDTTPNAIYVENHDHSLRLQISATEYRFDGHFGNLSRPIVSQDGTIFAPIEVLTLLSDEVVVLNGTKLDRKS